MKNQKPLFHLREQNECFILLADLPEFQSDDIEIELNREVLDLLDLPRLQEALSG